MAWNYEELIESFMEEYEENKNVYHQSHYEAVAQTFNEHYSEKQSDDMEKAILWVIGAELRIQQPRVYIKAKEKYIQSLELIDFQKVKEYIKTGQLTEQELEELRSRRDKVLKEIEKVPVDLCPSARWFYEEINEVVNYFFENSNRPEETTEQIIDFFEREFINKLCAKKIVYVAIAENLVLQKKPIPDHIKSDIQNRCFDNSNFELSEQESLDLSQRIDRLLEKLVID